MESRFSTTLPFLLALMALALVSCSGLNTKNHVPLVFALNLSDRSASVQLMKGDRVLVDFSNLAPGESRALTKIEDAEGVILRTTGQTETAWTDPSGTPYALRLETGHLYSVVIDPQGRSALYSLPESYSSLPKLCIVNITDTILSQVQVAPDWAKNVKVYAQDLVSLVPTEFYSIEPKTLGLYWQTPGQVFDGGHVAAREPSGQERRLLFETGRYYLFLAGEGSVRDITPTLD